MSVKNNIKSTNNIRNHVFQYSISRFCLIFINIFDLRIQNNLLGRCKYSPKKSSG